MAEKAFMTSELKRLVNDFRLQLETSTRSRFCKALIQAIETDKRETVVELLKQVKGDDNILDTVVDCTTPLLRAIFLGRSDFVSLLISHGASVNWMGNDPLKLVELPLHLACKAENVEVATILVKAGADVNKRNFKRRTPLCAAVYSSVPELVNLLLTNGATIKPQWHYHDCPLYTAIMCLGSRYMEPMVVTLLRHGAPTDTCDEMGFSLLILALQISANAAARLLIECGATYGLWTMSPSSREDAFDKWLNEQMSSPLTLKCLSAQAVRIHLVTVHKQSILEHLLQLELPKSLIEYITLDRFVQKASLTV